MLYFIDRKSSLRFGIQIDIFMVITRCKRYENVMIIDACEIKYVSNTKCK